MNRELERFEPGEVGGRLSYEHLHRYGICRDLVTGRTVLDVACGAGYGTNILADVAAEVTGVDIDSGAIRRAKGKYRRPNLKFVKADCLDLPFGDGTFDAVVANEMIEHIEDHDAFLDEAQRVLKADGVLLVSTPNKPVYNRYKSPNPFHVSEMDLPEFQTLLEGHFKHVRLVGLRMALVSASFQIDESATSRNMPTAKTYRGDLSDRERPKVTDDELSLEEPEYVLALCSDQPIEDLPSYSTIYYSADDDLWLEHEKIMAWASQLHEEDELLRADLRHARSELDEVREALEAEKRAGGDAARTGHLAISSRLLSRLTKSQVEADPAAVIEAMFALNERLVTQEARLEALPELQRKTEALEKEVTAREEARSRLLGELRDVNRQLDELRNERRESRDEQGRLLSELKESEQLLNQLRGNQDRLNAELRQRDESLQELYGEQDRLSAELARQAENLEALGKQLESEELERQRLEREAEASRKDAANARSRKDALETEIAEIRAEFARKVAALEIHDQSKVGGSPSGDPQPLVDSRARRRGQLSARLTESQQGRRARLVDAQRNVQDQLAMAEGAADSVATGSAPPRRRSLTQRLRKRHPLRDTPLFDGAWVERQLGGEPSPSADEYFRNPLFHWVETHPLFAASEYLERYPDVAESGMSPLEHYLRHGWREGRSPHRYFANDWYLQQNPDVLEAGINPLEHYLGDGWREGRRPNPAFDPAQYLAAHPDVDESGMEPLTHFVAHGAAEGREIPFRGLEKDWRALVSAGEGSSLLDHLLYGEVSEVPAKGGGDWPPAPLSDYWLPQKLRDFLIERHGEEWAPLYWYLCSVMDAFVTDPDAFPDSDACDLLLDRIRSKSEQASARQLGRPDATIVIPVYNNFLDTILCIASILETGAKASFDILVADDGSSDSTPSLASIGGVVSHLRQPKNQGFLANVNEAAKAARGRTLVILNNDTLVLPGWLDGLMAPFAQSDRIGLTGSKLINWDGTLQEAGGIFWEDGSAWNFGRGQDARAPEFNYQKEADYCSGASIAVPADLWQQMGGFDPLFAPAYCEDADLAFRIRAAGYTAIYNPQSEVIHHEGRSHGRDTSSGIKAHQVTNQARLLERWRDTLERHHFPNGENVLKARDRSADRKHVLVVDHHVPQWNQDAGSRTIFQYLEIFLDLGFQVSFWPDNLYCDPLYAPILQSMGIEVIYGPQYRDGFDAFMKERGSLYDAVFISRPNIAERYLPSISKHSSATIIYYGHDLHFRRMETSRQIGLEVDPSSIEDMRRCELEVCRACDVVFYPDPEEVALVAEHVGPSTRVIPNPVFVYDEQQLALAQDHVEKIVSGKGARMLFVGSFNHSPNREGIIWFAREVLPKVVARLPHASLQIVGSNPPADVSELRSGSIEVLGRVSDEMLAELYDAAAVAVAPLRYGAGVKGKVIEAMALGVPVATTSIGAQGIDGKGEALFVGDTADTLADEIVRALTDRKTAANRARKALDFIREHYGRQAMETLFRELIAEPAPARRRG